MGIPLLGVNIQMKGVAGRNEIITHQLRCFFLDS